MDSVPPNPDSNVDDKIFKALREARPSWLEDAYGLKGPDPYHIGVPPPIEVGRYDVKVETTPASPRFPEATNTEGEPSVTGGGSGNLYDFQMSDKSDADGNKVQILDGFVFSPTDIIGVMPQGMGNDDFTLSVVDGDDVYLVITLDPDTFQTTSATIAAGSPTPKDTEEVIYFTIGNVSVDPNSNALTAENQLCGDCILPWNLQVTDETAQSAEGVALDFTTNGDENIDLTVSPGVTGRADVVITSSANLIQTLNDFQTRITNLETAIANASPC